MPRSNEKLRVYLKAAVRRNLEALCRQGSAPATKVRKARILLMADANQSGGAQPDHAIGLCQRQAVRVRQEFARGGDVPALERKPRSRPGTTARDSSRTSKRSLTSTAKRTTTNTR